jgi:hypothetical protein
MGPDGEAWVAGENARIAEIQDELTRALQTLPSGNEELLDKALTGLLGAQRTEIQVPTAAEVLEYRAIRAPIVAAERRRDMEALAPLGPLDRSGASLGFLSPRWFRHLVANEARIAVARTAAAIRAFQFREGRPPRVLEELVGSLPPDATLDPFDGKPLLYEVDGSGWRVASRVWRDSWTDAWDGKVEDYPAAEVRFPRQPK